MILRRLKEMLWTSPGVTTRSQPERFMPPSGTIAEQWQAYYAFQVRHGGYRSLLESALDPFRNWNQDICYGWHVESDVTNALALKYVAREPDIAAALLARALAIAERTRTDSHRAHFSANDKLRLECGEAYARWMTGGIVDVAMLSRAYHFAMQSAGVQAYDDDDDARDAEIANTFVRDGALLSAARVALIAGQADRAMMALRSCRRSGKGMHATMAEALQRSAQVLKNSPSKDRLAARAAITQIFDRFRPPAPVNDFRDFWGGRELTTFELGVIRAQLEGEGPIELQSVYRAVAAP